MNRAALRADLALWQRRHAYRQRRLDAAHARDDKQRIKHWHSLLEHAGDMIRQRRAQLTPLRERAYRVAASLIGVMESGGNNSGPMVSRIIKENGGGGPEAWCGDFVAYIYRHAGSHSVSRPWASVRLIGQLLGIRRIARPQRGDLVRFDFDHIGIYVCDVDPETIETIEGNTGAIGAVSDSLGGDGVYRKHRAKSLVRDYLRVGR